MRFPENWKYCALLLRAFKERDVKYVIIGSMAASYYRPQTRVSDMDLLISPTCRNLTKVLHAINLELWRQYPVRLNADPADLAKPCGHIALKRWGINADVLTPISGFDFAKALSRSISIEIGNDISVPIASQRDLDRLKSFQKLAESSRRSGSSQNKSDITKL